jgi:hypothetical protein
MWLGFASKKASTGRSSVTRGAGVVVFVLSMVVVMALAAPVFAQAVLLSADGQTDTYTLINHALGGTAEETPDCSHPDFGPHITQQFDDTLGEYVFAFWIHVTPDNDRCITFDRQRNEIKTYGPSPAYLKGFLGETVSFQWAFKLDDGFQPSPSFTHIHQIKAGDGPNADAPIITITPRSGNPDFLQIIHTDSVGLSTTIARTDLESFKGAWVLAQEQITYATNGGYALTLTSLATGAELLSVSNGTIDMWRDGSTFVRPKWGIYRSLNRPEYLRDEVVLFADFCLAKGSDTCPGATYYGATTRVLRGTGVGPRTLHRGIAPGRASAARVPHPTPIKH